MPPSPSSSDLYTRRRGHLASPVDKILIVEKMQSRIIMITQNFLNGEIERPAVFIAHLNGGKSVSTIFRGGEACLFTAAPAYALIIMREFFFTTVVLGEYHYL